MTRSSMSRWRHIVLALAAAMFLGGTCRAAMEPATSTGTNAAELADVQAVGVLERMGHYDEAETRCLKLLEQHPNNQTAKQLLGEIEEKKRHQDSPSGLQRQLEETIIPEVNVRDAAAGDVIDFLQTESQKRSGDKTPINFVWQAPEDAKTAKVTLNLRGVPLADILKYVTESAGLRYRVDPYAIVIYKAPPVEPNEPTPANVKPQ
jgi:hypothetical protein